MVAKTPDLNQSTHLQGAKIFDYAISAPERPSNLRSAILPAICVSRNRCCGASASAPRIYQSSFGFTAKGSHVPSRAAIAKIEAPDHAGAVQFPDHIAAAALA